MDNLGYSFDETRDKYIAQMESWNRINNLNLPFEYLFDVINKIDLNKITEQYIFSIEPHVNGFRDYLKIIIEQDVVFKKLNTFNKKEEYDSSYSLDDFLNEVLDGYILLRLICENDDNLNYNLNWQYLDIIESGWASYEDIR